MENLDIIQFAQLLKPSTTEKSKSEKKSVPQALSVSSNEPMVEAKQKREEEELEEYPPIPCTDEEMNVVIDKWMVDGVLKPFKPSLEPTLEDTRKPFYCWYHRYVSHGTHCLSITKGKPQ